jgi:MFS family permease
VDRSQTSGSPFAAFHSRAFAVIWSATVIANIGTWMYNAAAGWLMMSLDPDPFVVSLVQVATALPMFLFALPAGALADIVDKRRFLIASNVAVTAVTAGFAVLVALDLATAPLLLAFTFLASAVSALAAPAWQSIVPQLVAKPDLTAAIGANSAGINVSRAVGPALGGAIIAAWGIVAPFALNAVSNIGVIAALVWWRPQTGTVSTLPRERFLGAIRIGLRHASHNAGLRATLVRAVAFFLFASAYWSLLPLVARERIAGGPAFYGVLLGTIGAGAVGGALLLPALRARLGTNAMVAGGALCTGAALVLFAVAHTAPVAVAASLVSGVSWIAVLSSLNISAQSSLPNWVRGRGLAVFVTVFFGAMTVGSLLWGWVATRFGIPAALLGAAAGIALAVPLTWRWALPEGAAPDLAPSLHWPAPIQSWDVPSDRGPVLVIVEYRVMDENRGAFLRAMAELSAQRRRDGAFEWTVYEDAAEQGRYLEAFRLDSWLEHLRQHERVTRADRYSQEELNRLHCEGVPQVRHFISTHP